MDGEKTDIKTSIRYIERDIADIKDWLKNGYVRKEEFEPVKRVVYGLVTVILVAVVTAIIYLVIQRQ